MQALAEVYRRLGTTLRAFSAAGWFRYSSHPANVVVGPTGQVILVDLDSCRKADPSRPDLWSLEAVRDGMSALYNLACSFFRPGTLDALTDDELAAREPFSAFLDGWDPDSAGANHGAGRAIAAYVIESRIRLREFSPFLRSAEPVAARLYRHVRHDRDLTFAWLYRMAFERRVRRPHPAPVPFGLEALDERLLRFAGRARFERLGKLRELAFE
jgi:hypothetical protein